MQLLNATNLPTYLPGDASYTPFGDPYTDATCTSASPGVFTVPGYNATNGDKLVLSAGQGGSIPTGLTAGTLYYVVGASGDTFSVATTSGGSAINTSSTGSAITVHFVANDAGIQNIPLPFKPDNTVLALNLSGGSLTLQGAADAGGGYGDPQGPGTWSTIAVVGATSAALVNLNYDWIRVSTSGTIALIQN